MTRQSSKAQLLQDIQTEHQRLEKNLAPLSQEEMTLPGVVGTWSVKDLLAHLIAWEQLLVRWYRAGLRNENPEPSPVGMSRTAIDALNRRIYESHQWDTLDQVLLEFRTSFQQTLAMLEPIPEEDMFARDRFAWTGGLTLADYIAGNTCNHYAWAKSKIRKWAITRARS